MSGQNPILTGGVESNQSIDETFSVTHNSDKRGEGYHPVGTRGSLPDGRVFFYGCSDGTGITRGKLAIATTLNLGTGHYNIAVAAAQSVGDKSLTVDLTTTDTPENLYKDGYLWVNDVDGEGQYFRVVSHNELDTSDAGSVITFNLDRELKVALTTSSQVSVIRNPFQSLALSTTASTDYVAGVPLVSFGASGTRTLSAAEGGTVTSISTVFGWVQTAGPAAILIGDTSGLGVPVMSGTAAGEVEDAIATTGATPSLANMIVGTVLHVAADTEYALVELALKY